MFQPTIRRPQCSVCMRPYNTTVQLPIMISTCGHTFCMQCCMKILQCPVCRKGFHKTSLVKNFAMIQLIEPPTPPPLPKPQPPVNPSTITQSTFSLPSQNSSIKPMFTCVSDGGKIIWDSDFNGKCGVCRYDRSGCWQCVECSFLFCMDCGKNARNLAIACISDGGKVLWDRRYNGKCGNCRAQRSGCWQCQQCQLLFCTECGINNRNMQMRCLNDGGQLAWESSFVGRCGFCGYERNGCWQCQQCSYLFCTQCGKTGNRLGLVCINDGSKVVWEHMYNGKCGYCRVQIRGCWECTQCRAVFCTACGKKGQNVRIVCINDRSPVTWDKNFNGKCAACRYERKGCWICTECGVKFCTQCGKKG